ncbi:Pleiotropic drug resistance protein 4 [Apostasia shenzhenica]|uniref:Pleiotropic drug resistance protein 4 n=1 Tax=Apostasia shenzhenica TaxID=1088818 RepID=A0A2I0BA71_9ASPA|nr:Pleiotropic drug resistance protein 4 [Apostasia shenzhenica]
MSSVLYRSIAVLGRTLVIANTLAVLVLLVCSVFGGFILSYDKVSKWWIWGFWTSPIMYAQNAIFANEFFGNSWSHVIPGSNQTLGVAILKSRGMFSEAKWYWIGIAALFGYVLVFNFLFTIALAYLKRENLPHVLVCQNSLSSSLNLKHSLNNPCSLWERPSDSI